MQDSGLVSLVDAAGQDGESVATAEAQMLVLGLLVAVKLLHDDGREEKVYVLVGEAERTSEVGVLELGGIGAVKRGVADDEYGVAIRPPGVEELQGLAGFAEVGDRLLDFDAHQVERRGAVHASEVDTVQGPEAGCADEPVKVGRADQVAQLPLGVDNPLKVFGVKDGRGLGSRQVPAFGLCLAECLDDVVLTHASKGGDQHGNESGRAP